MSTGKSFKFIDLFCGCGGFSTGLEMAGHECLLGVDFDPYAIESFKLNHKNAQSYCGDIKNLSSKEIQLLIGRKKIDMIVGGPPCQGFSTVGAGQASDQRNTLFREFVRIVSDLEPKVVIMENVTGLLAKKNEKLLFEIFKSFESLGYNMDARVLSSEEYGVPEKRRRTFIIGVQKGEVLFPRISYGPRGRKSFQTVGQALGKIKLGKTYFNHDTKLAQIKNTLDFERLKCIPEGRGIRYQKDEQEYLPKKLWYNVNWSELREERFRQTKLQRLDRKTPGPTILTSRTTYYHPTENRYLTPREAALIQSFPLHFKFAGSQTSVFRQIGNAVPPKLAQAIGETLYHLKFGVFKKEVSGQELRQSLQHAFIYSKETKI